MKRRDFVCVVASGIATTFFPSIIKAGEVTPDLDSEMFYWMEYFQTFDRRPLTLEIYINEVLPEGITLRDNTCGLSET